MFKNFKFFFKTNNSKIFLKHNKYNITLVKQQNFDSFAIKEIDFFQKFNNSKFIPNYYSSFIHNNKSYLEIQYFSQGNLLNFIENISLTYNTNQINQYKQFKFNYIKQMIQILYFLKKNSLLHLDIKLENFILSNNNQLKLIDFTSYIFYDYNNKYKIYIPTVGTKIYMPPELYFQNYVYFTSDIWSLGITIFLLTINHNPLKNQIISSQDDINKNLNYYITNNELKNFIKEMLIFNEKERISIDELINHNFLKNQDNWKLFNV